jgi:hypothetical protein
MPITRNRASLARTLLKAALWSRVRRRHAPTHVFGALHAQTPAARLRPERDDLRGIFVPWRLGLFGLGAVEDGVVAWEFVDADVDADLLSRQSGRADDGV